MMVVRSRGVWLAMFGAMLSNDLPRGLTVAVSGWRTRPAD